METIMIIEDDRRIREELSLLLNKRRIHSSGSDRIYRGTHKASERKPSGSDPYGYQYSRRQWSKSVRPDQKNIPGSGDFC